MHTVEDKEQEGITGCNNGIDCMLKVWIAAAALRSPASRAAAMAPLFISEWLCVGR
jgi:hypothetical protein